MTFDPRKLCISPQQNPNTTTTFSKDVSRLVTLPNLLATSRERTVDVAEA